MMSIHLDAAGSLLSFTGGVVLAWDALQAPSRVRQRLGAAELASAAERAGKPDLYRFEEGRPLGRPGAMDIWLAGVSYRAAVSGLILILFGFLIDLLSKTAGYNPQLFPK